MNKIIDRKEYLQYWVARNIIDVSDKSKIDEKEVEDFVKKHKEVITPVLEYMPRGMTSIGAAVGKCAIKYDVERAIQFLKNSKYGIFEGKEDPVYHFFLWLKGIKGPKRKKSDISTHEIAFYACKQYCLGKKIKRLERSKEAIKWQKN